MTLQEQPIEEKSGMYRDPSFGALLTRVKGGHSVFSRFLRLKEVRDVEVTVDVGVIDFMSGSIIPGTYTVSEQHNVNVGEVFVFSYVSIFRESVVIPEPLITTTNFSTTILNYNTSSGFTFTIRFYIYEVLKRN